MRRPIIRLSVVTTSVLLTAALGVAPAYASPIDDGLAAVGNLLPGAPHPDKPKTSKTAPSTPKARPTTSSPKPSTTTSAAPTPAAAPAGERVDLVDGTSILLPHNASAATKVSMLTDVRERLTAQGMDLLNRLMSLLPGTNGPSRGTPVLTVTPTTGLRSGATVTVSGKGYRSGENVYVTQTIAKPSSGYPSTYADAKKVTVGSTGTFSTQIAVTSTFGKVNCLRTACFVASFTAFPKLADRSQDAWVPISFSAAGGPAETSPSAPGRPAAPVAPRPGAGPSVSVDRTSGLNPSGDSVTVSGSGFSTSGPGVYVGIAQSNQFSVTDQSSFDDRAVWVATSNGRMRADGSFSVQLPVKAKFGRADCTTSPCAVYTFAAHGSSDRSQDTATGVSFTGGPAADRAVAVPTDGGRSRPAPPAENRGTGTASTSLSTSTIAATGTTSVTVNGTGFATTGPGVYVGVAETGKYSTTDSSAYNPVTWVPSTQISADGSFSVTLDVAPVFGAGNCIKNACAVYTFAAHGSSDRSQDTSSPLTVAGTAAEKARALSDGPKPGAPSSTAPGSSTAPAVAAAGDPSAPTTTASAQDDSSTNWWAWGGGALAVVIAAAAGYGAARLRN
ncbi:Neocarzinostatin family protein [Gordonia malaquae]|uniref:IPT/TIG domain-containing protein n=1 Tax=Gordonia malaquae NBRC 108250 TaxID=1223542 RepID=M3TG50_GORML|nr:neocarzinostatin apoprotein domain-containing protein [Gordonia malaquae]GAC80446.1 hypothetical protein GM1_018_00090 [Gordonia malaquae NBRC 108250]SEE14002.1 Neocarzinostatin family protein [Gordonia malaquae]